MKPDKLLCYIFVFVRIFGLDRAQTTKDFKSVEATDQYSTAV